MAYFRSLLDIAPMNVTKTIAAIVLIQKSVQSEKSTC